MPWWRMLLRSTSSWTVRRPLSTAARSVAGVSDGKLHGRVPSGASPVFAHADPDAGKAEFVAVYPDATGGVAAAAGRNAPRATRLTRTGWPTDARSPGPGRGSLRRPWVGLS
jgi:hypothetical protein